MPKASLRILMESFGIPKESLEILQNSVLRITCRLLHCAQCRTAPRGARARARPRARGGALLHCPEYKSAAGDPPSFGLLKESQKIQIQFWELHVGFCIVDNAELRRGARARASARARRRASALPRIQKRGG